MGADGRLQVPDEPIIPFIEGDGTGPDIWRASVRVLDAAVEKAYGGKKKIAWLEVLAGEKAKRQLDNWLPDETVEAYRKYLVGINTNYNDTATLTNLTICGGGTTICEKYTGKSTGAEPPATGSGPDGTNCSYTNSDITNL